MAYFPTSPLDGASVTVNGILYTYNAAKGAWKRAPTTIGNLNVTGNITAANITLTSNAAANKFYVTEGVFWAGNGVAFASSTYSNANVASYLLTGAVIGDGSSNVVIGATTQSGSTTTGALVVQGGAGIAGNLYVGGNLVVSNVSYEYREVITTTETVQGNIVAASGTASTNTTTGALVVVGGAGISGALFITNTNDVSANIGTLFLGNLTTQANIGTLFLGNASTQANLGAFQTYANANIGSLVVNAATQQTQINNIITNANANVAAYLPTYTGNIGAGNIITSGTSGNISGVNYILASNYVYPNGVSILTGIGGTYSNTNVEAYFGANIGSLLVNSATQATSINTINANLGAYQIYANANIGTLFAGNLSTQANLGAFQTYANTTFTTYSNANVTAYLPTHAGNIAAGNVIITSNVYASKYYYSNGVSILSGIPAGSDKQIQFNNGGVFGASSGLIYDDIHLKVYGNLETLYSSGDEGGEIILAKPQTNTTLAGNISVDIYQNKLRIFENGGTTRGFYLDISSASAGVGTNIMSGGGGSGTPGGSDTQLQFNDGSTFNGANITFNKATGNLVVSSVTTSTSASTGALVVKGGVGVAGNVYSDKFYTANGIFWAANGAAFNGISFYASSAVPTSVSTGTLWYKTTTDVLYEYINDGITDYWIDISSQTIAANTSGVSTFAGTVFGANITFTGSITGTVGYLIERANVVASAPPAVTNLDLITAPILYFTSNTTQNITANIRGNSTVSLNSLLSIGQSTTFVIFVPNATAYYVNTIKVDNTTVTPFWQGGLTVSGGNANSIDIYTFAVLKTANATFKVFASQVKYQNLGP